MHIAVYALLFYQDKNVLGALIIGYFSESAQKTGTLHTGSQCVRVT